MSKFSATLPKLHRSSICFSVNILPPPEGNQNVTLKPKRTPFLEAVGRFR